MLALSIVEEIVRLLKEGRQSQRKIAKRLGVSRGTVSALANGQRGLFGRAREAEETERGPLLPPQRCPKCGFFVHLPCLVCRTREYRHGRRLLAAMAAERPLGTRRPRRSPVRGRRRSCHARVA
jgi:transposase-like protein